MRHEVHRRFRFRLGHSFVVFAVSDSRILWIWSRMVLRFFSAASLFSSVAKMYRGPVRPQRSPGGPRPAGRFPSPSSCWGFPGPRSPYGGFGHRGGSPHSGGPRYSPGSPGSPAHSPGLNRGYRTSSPAGFGSGSRGYGGQMWRRGGGFPRPHSSSPAPGHKFQVKFLENQDTCSFQ